MPWGITAFKYNNFSPDYMGDDKIRVIRLVNEENGFYHSGDSIAFGTKNFVGYDSDGEQTVDTGYTIHVNDLTDGKYSITVEKE